MQALILRRVQGDFSGRARLEEVDAPSLEIPQDVLVRIEYAELSLEDHRVVTGQVPSRAPVILGRHGVGRVEDPGPRVDTDRLPPGTRVVLDTVVACPDIWPPEKQSLARSQFCPDCESGALEQCTRVRPGPVAGQSRDGTLAGRIVLPQGSLHVVPPELDSKVALLAPLLAHVQRALDAVGARPGLRLLVIGGTPLGLMTIIRARDMGLSVALTDPDVVRTEVGREFVERPAWALRVQSTRDNPADRLREDVFTLNKSLENSGFSVPCDAVIDALGTHGDRGLYLCRPGGRVAVVGRESPCGPPILRWQDLVAQGKSLLGIPSGKGHVAQALTTMSRGLPMLDKLSGTAIESTLLPDLGWTRLGVDPQTGSRESTSIDRVPVVFPHQ